MKSTPKLANNIHKSIKAAAIAGILAMFSTTALAAVANNALPTNGSFVGGSGSIISNNGAMTVNQTQANAAIKWDTFNVGANAKIDFNFNGSKTGSYNVLNYSENAGVASEIYGRINAGANANVWIVNPNGIIVGPSAQIDVGHLHLAAHKLNGSSDYNSFINNGSADNLGQHTNAQLMSLGNISTNSITFDGGKVVIDADRLSFKDNASVFDNAILGLTDNTTSGHLTIKNSADHTPEVVVGYSNYANGSFGSFKNIQLNSSGKNVGYAWIENLEQLQNINNSLNGAFALRNSIDASSLIAGEGFTPIGSSTNKFTGSFEGLGHDIYGLTINRPNSDDVGLFGYVGNNASIKNVNLIGGAIVGQNNVASLVGHAEGTGITIQGISSSARVLGVENVGGIVGYAKGNNDSNKIAISDVTNMALIRGYQNVGGIAGKMVYTTVQGRTDNAGRVQGIDKYTDTLIANETAQERVDKQYATPINDTVVKDQGSNLEAGDTFKVTNGGLTMAIKIAYVTNSSKEIKDSDNVTLNNLSNNDRIYGYAQNDIYEIKKGDLIYFERRTDGYGPYRIHKSTNEDYYFSYFNYTDLRHIAAASQNSGGIAGSAQYSTIGNSSTSSYQIQNKASVLGSENVGGIIGHAQNITLQNIANVGVIGDASYNSYGTNVAGLVGIMDSGTISTSYNTAAIYNGLNNTAGLVGTMNGGSLENVFNTGDVTVHVQKDVASSNVGGLVGDFRDGTISKAYNLGKLTSILEQNASNSINSMGGIAGSAASHAQNWFAVEQVYSTTEILAQKYNTSTGEYDKQNHGDDKVVLSPTVPFSGKGLVSYGYFIYPEDYDNYTVGVNTYDSNYNGKYSKLDILKHVHNNPNTGDPGTHGTLNKDQYNVSNQQPAAANTAFFGLLIGTTYRNNNIANNEVTPTTSSASFAGNWHVYRYDKATGTTVNTHTEDSTIATLPILNAFVSSNKNNVPTSHEQYGTLKYIQYGDEKNPLNTYATYTKDGVNTTVTYYANNGIVSEGIAKQNDTIYISSATELKTELAKSNGLNQKYVLVQDINADEVAGVLSTGNFTGQLDGNGHTIYGLTSSLFNTNSGKIENLTISGAYLAGSSSQGLIANTNTGTIENIHTFGNTIKVSGSTAGSIVGSNQGTIAKVQTEDMLYAQGNSNLGGIAGVNSSSITNAESRSALVTVLGNAESLGGIVGTNTGAIQNASNWGQVHGSSNVGGIIGTNNSNSTLDQLANLNPVKGVINVGGILGTNKGTINQGTLINHAAAAVTGGNYVGGIVGVNQGVLMGSRDAGDNYYEHEIYNNAPVKATASNGTAGGIAGENTGTISLVYNTGEVTADIHHGLVGQNANADNLTKSFSTTDTSSSLVKEFLTNVYLRLEAGVTAAALTKTYDGAGEGSFNIKYENGHIYLYKGASTRLGEILPVDGQGKHNLSDYVNSSAEAQGKLIKGSSSISKDAGTYDILETKQLAGNNNLGFNFVQVRDSHNTVLKDAVSFTINKKDLTWTAQNIERTYGNAALTSGAYEIKTANGFVGNEGSSVKAVLKTNSDGAVLHQADWRDGQQTNNAGAYHWTGILQNKDASNDVLKNYNYGEATGDSKVNRANLTIALKDVIMRYNSSEGSAHQESAKGIDGVAYTNIANQYGIKEGQTALNGDSLESVIRITGYSNEGFTNSKKTQTKAVVYGTNNQPAKAAEIGASYNNLQPNNYNLTIQKGNVIITPVVLNTYGSTVYRTYGNATPYFDPKSDKDRKPVQESSQNVNRGQISGWLEDIDKKAAIAWVSLSQTSSGEEDVIDYAVRDEQGTLLTDKTTNDVGEYIWQNGTWKMNFSDENRATLNNYRLYNHEGQYVQETYAGGLSIVEKADLILTINNVTTPQGTAFDTSTYGFAAVEGVTNNDSASHILETATQRLEAADYVNPHAKDGTNNSFTDKAGLYPGALTITPAALAKLSNALGNYELTVVPGDVLISISAQSVQEVSNPSTQQDLYPWLEEAQPSIRYGLSAADYDLPSITIINKGMTQPKTLLAEYDFEDHREQAEKDQ